MPPEDSHTKATAPAQSVGISARTRISPFFEATRRWGCRAYGVYNHMYMPLYYQGLEKEYWHLIEHVCLWDVAVERQVEITGPEAARFVQLLTPRNLSSCQVGQCLYAPLTDENGGLINDPVLLRLDENHFWLSLADSDALLWAKGLAVGLGMNVHLCEPDVSPLQVQGPKSTAVLCDLLGSWIDELRYFRLREAEIDGIPLVVSRTGWSGERGYEVYLRDGTRGDDLWEAIMAAGRRYDIAPGAPNQIRRIEAGLISYGADASLTENPFELGLDRLVDLDQQAEFIGKAALKRIKAAGVDRRLVGLEIPGAPLALSNERCWPLEGHDPARFKITSAVYSPGLEKNIAMALVPAEQAEVGTAHRFRAPFATIEASVVPLPFTDPAKRRARG